MIISKDINDCLNDKDKEIVEDLGTELKTIYNKKEISVHVGDTFNELNIVKVIKFKERSGRITKGCICRCSCGNYIGPIRIRSILCGDNCSCGCYQRKLHSQQLSERNFKHGDKTRNNVSRLYTIWCGMKERSTNSNTKCSQYYCNKIEDCICEEWKDYKNFKKWAINNGYRDDLTIDRIDSNKGYCPENCRWATWKEQAQNKKKKLINLSF